MDSATGQPIENATVAVLLGYYQKVVTKTGINGDYNISVNGGFHCSVYAYYDGPGTPGYDYLPKFRGFDLGMGVEVNIDFYMVPAASVLIVGDLLFVYSPTPAESYSFTVVPREESPNITGSVFTYGTTTDTQNRLFNIIPKHVIVPANTSLQIEVKDQLGHAFVMDDPQRFYLNMGERLQVSIDQYSLPYNINLTKDIMRFVDTHVNETEQMGFYIQAEKRDLEKVSLLIESAEEKFVVGLYQECYADLREAYTKAVHIDEKVQLMYVDASTSTSIIIVFLALTSTCLSYFLFEHWAHKILANGLVYALFLAILFNVYTGSQLVGLPFFLEIAGLSIFVSLLMVFILPRLFPSTIMTVFSMAKRSLRGRKTRFILTLVPVTILVMGFVSLTSFTIEYGFTSTVVGVAKPGSEGLLVRQSIPTIPSLVGMFVGAEGPPEVDATFTPFKASVVEWLQKKPEVILIAPKVENIPSRRPLGSLFEQRIRLDVYGILGILPSAEAETTGFDSLVVEGRYLYDDEEDSILISVRAAQNLNVQVGEQLALRIGSSSIEVKLVGLLDDYSLSRITDFDGSLMIPEKLFIRIEDGTVMEARMDPCDPSEVVVTDWRMALKLSPPFISLSRIDALVEDYVDILPFARQIALERDYWVWAAVGGSVNLMGLMPYLETKGLFIFIPWLIVILNVVITMVNAIYERKKEIAIFSSVGLNPTHITSLFGAEALMIGVIGGGVGYLLGLSLYRLMSLLSLNIVVEQKISALWSLASLGIAVIAVIVGAFMALRFSVIITPSLLRRWKAEGERREGGPLVFEIPIKIPQQDIASLLDHVRIQLQAYKDKAGLWMDRIRQTEEETPQVIHKSLKFTYHQGLGLSAYHSRNEIVASKVKGDRTYTLKLVCDADERQAYKTASFVRNLFIKWSTLKKRK